MKGMLVAAASCGPRDRPYEKKKRHLLPKPKAKVRIIYSDYSGGTQFFLRTIKRDKGKNPC